MFKKILVAIDGSEQSQKALKSAGELASKLGSEMIVLTVVPPITMPFFEEGSFTGSYISNYDDDLRESYSEALNKATQELKKVITEYEKVFAEYERKEKKGYDAQKKAGDLTFKLMNNLADSAEEIEKLTDENLQLKNKIQELESKLTQNISQPDSQ